MPKYYLVLILLFASNFMIAQGEKRSFNETEIFIIDSYFTPEPPFMAKIYFFTSDSVESSIIFNENQRFSVSKKSSLEHKFEISIDSLSADSSSIPYKVVIFNEYGKSKESDVYDLYLPSEFELQVKDESNFLNICAGGLFYLIPFPAYFIDSDNRQFSLTKEFPLVSFYGRGYNFPKGYISLEYSYIFEAEKRNYLRFGYKQIFQTEVIEYMSAGLNLTTNFSGFNGFSPEISFGLFEFYDSFTLYLRYRYNFNVSSSYQNFHDISIGLFTSVFSFNL